MTTVHATTATQKTVDGPSGKVSALGVAMEILKGSSMYMPVLLCSLFAPFVMK